MSKTLPSPLAPTIPQTPLGIRMEPPPSAPKAMGHNPKVVEIYKFHKKTISVTSSVLSYRTQSKTNKNENNILPRNLLRS